MLKRLINKFIPATREEVERLESELYFASEDKDH